MSNNKDHLVGQLTNSRQNRHQVTARNQTTQGYIENSLNYPIFLLSLENSHNCVNFGLIHGAFMKGPKTDPSSAFLALKLTWFESQLLLVLSHSFLIPIIHFVPKPPYHSLTQYSLSVKNGSLNNLGRRLHRYLGHKKLSMSQSRNPFTATGRLSQFIFILSQS